MTEAPLPGAIRWDMYSMNCGPQYPLYDGSPTECNPDGEFPCCSFTPNSGKCKRIKRGQKCFCKKKICIDYKEIYGKWGQFIPAIIYEIYPDSTVCGRTLSYLMRWGHSDIAYRNYEMRYYASWVCGSELDLNRYPCCNKLLDECGNRASHCSCPFHCIDFRFVVLWRRSGGTLKWRLDGLCGSAYPLPDGAPTECNPDGTKPCCNDGQRGHCGNGEEYCSCRRCTDYKFIKWWLKSGKPMWRNDQRCGRDYTLPNGTVAECNPDGANPCCDNRRQYCGNTAYYCSCTECTDYKFIKWWRESGKPIWRNDRRCGSNYPLPDGRAAECNPDGNNACCSESGQCGSTEIHCFCTKCKDFKVRESEKGCSIIKTETGFLKKMCFDEERSLMQYQCIHSDDDYYRPDYDSSLRLKGVTEVCTNDKHGYQACGFHTEITNALVLCGGYFCKQRSVGEEYRYIKCRGEDCKNENRPCRVSSNPDTVPLICDDRCDKEYCEDESFCDGYQYGVNCTRWTKDFVPTDLVCNGVFNCANGTDEQNCSDTNKTVCTHYWRREHRYKNVTVPILNNTRCSVFDISKQRYPYCTNYLDQTNCSDIKRVGGYCRINGFWSNVSKYMVCYEYKKNVIDLCDDNIQNNCLSLPNTLCKIHKHRMCDGIKDCSGGIDETDVMCEFMSDEFKFSCIRTFHLGLMSYKIPVSWIMDNETDCLSGEDENMTMWNMKYCPGNINQMELPNGYCPKVFKCPDNKKLHVHFKYLCNGIETCDNHGESRVCKISRDLADMDNTAPLNGTIRSVCTDENITTCEIKQFKKPWGDVFGESTIEVYVPDSKVKCSGLLGEYYLFLSCMDLCAEKNIKCPLNDEMRLLTYDSCPDQFPDRAYTLGNNSFLTFVIESERGQYQQEFYKCNNRKCIEYNKVCDLVDHCGDLSDELSCQNHMICQNTLKEPLPQFIPLPQKCDGIYDCFDLSDECNDSCKRSILGGWVLKILCWLMGVLAVLFNLCTLIRGLSSLKTCRTDSMMISKVLISLIGSGDFLIGLYLIILSVYDSIIYGDRYCKAQPEWLTGVPCLILGVISTVGSQVSLFSMTAISCIRLHGLRSMRIPGPVNKKSASKVVLLAVTIILASLAIALIPMVPSFEDYFVQGIYYDPSYKVFIGFPNKERHITRIAPALSGLRRTLHISVPLLD